MTERQSARMSKIKNGVLGQYGAEPIEQQQFGTAGVERVTICCLAACSMYGASLGILNVRTCTAASRLLNFIKIVRELWSHIDFSRWRPWRGNSTSDFVFGDFAQFVRSKSTCIPNFGDTSQYTVEILLLPVFWNKRPPCWNSTSGFDFHVCVIICMPKFVQIGPSAT